MVGINDVTSQEGEGERGGREGCSCPYTTRFVYTHLFWALDVKLHVLILLMLHHEITLTTLMIGRTHGILCIVLLVQCKLQKEVNCSSKIIGHYRYIHTRILR